LNDDALRDYMVGQFQDHQWHLRESSDFYTGARRPGAIGVSVPPQMRQLLSSVGYPRLYVDALAERLEVEGFRLGSDESDDTLWDWWQINDLDAESTLGHTDAFVYRTSYITVSSPNPNEPGVDSKVPVIRVEPPTVLHAKIDPRTRQVTQAVRVIEDENSYQNVSVTVYLPDRTMWWTREDNKQWSRVSTVRHGLGMVPVIPLANRTSLADLYGTSQITPELRSITDAASRVMMDMQATAEMMAVPQRLLFGVSADDIGAQSAPLGDGKGHFDAYLARILAFEDPDAKAMQFSAAELRNFVDVLRELAKQAAAITGLPPQYLSSSTDNPASAEAIRASESRLVKTVETKARIFGSAWEQAMRVAWKVMNPDEQLPAEWYRMETVWRDPSTPTYASKADAAVKLYGNGTGLIPKRQARLDLGYTLTQIDRMEQWDAEDDPFKGMATNLVALPGNDFAAG
jgi:hypothetical protein